MRYRIELVGMNGERVIIGSVKTETETIHDAIVKAKKMKAFLEQPLDIENPVLLLPGNWLKDEKH